MTILRAPVYSNCLKLIPTAMYVATYLGWAVTLGSSAGAESTKVHYVVHTFVCRQNKCITVKMLTKQT